MYAQEISGKEKVQNLERNKKKIEKKRTLIKKRQLLLSEKVIVPSSQANLGLA